MFPSPLITSWLWASASCSVKQKVSTLWLWLQGLPSPAGPTPWACDFLPTWERSNNPFIGHSPLSAVPPSQACYNVSCPCSYTPSGPLFLGEVTGGFQAALDTSFYELCTFHFKEKETEAQNYKLFGKRGILPWALAMQAT